MNNTDTLAQIGDFSLALPFIRNIVWHLIEQNFRLELLALDRCLFPRHALGNQDRDIFVAEAVPDGVFVLRRPQRNDDGLGAVQWQDRMVYVERLRLILVTWPNAPAALKTMTAGVFDVSGAFSTTSEARVTAVEQVAYPFYCRTFFRFFGRAATVPCPFPTA